MPEAAPPDANLRITPSVLVAHRRWGPAVFAVLGMVAAAGQAPVSLPWLAVVAWALILWLLSMCQSAKRAAWRGWAAGFGYFGAGLHWIVEPFLVDIARHGWMAPFALLFMAGGLALFWGGAVGLAYWAGGANRTRRLLFLVLMLTLAEMLRGVVFTGFPWITIGHIWIGTAQMQLAAFVGSPGLTLLTLGAAAIPAILGARKILVGAVLASACLGAAAFFGQMRLPPGPAPVTGLTVRLIQPNAAQDLKWHPDHVARFYRRQLDFTAAAPPDGGPRPDIVIWPEIAVPFAYEPGHAEFAWMASQAQGAQLIFGMQGQQPSDRYANMLVHLDGQGAEAGRYLKHHLVPFGEYMPLADMFDRMGVFGLAANLAGGFEPGPGTQVLNMGVAGKVLPLICYEAVFPHVLRSAPSRADWIVHITNDAWFGDLTGPYQHLAQAQLRAVEQGLPVMRAANTGVSAAIDPYGRLLAGLPLGTAGFADLDLPEPLPPTPYVRWGDLPALVLIGVIGAAAAVFARAKPIDAPSGAP